MITEIEIQLSSGSIHLELNTPCETEDEAYEQAIKILKEQLECSKVSYTN